MSYILITGNKHKAEEVGHILGKKVHHFSYGLPEIQGTPEDIVRDKCKRALDLIHDDATIIVEDVSLSIDHLGGMPGPYIKWFLEAMDLDSIAGMFLEYHATATCYIAYASTMDKEIHVVSSSVRGMIVRPRGTNGFGYDPIFLPDGYDETYAEMDLATKNSISERYNAYRQLL